MADPSRHATTTSGYFSIEGLTNNSTYNVWVLGRSIHGRLSTGNITGTAMPSVPLGFKYTPDQVLAATAVETTTWVETAVVNTEKAIVEKSSTSSVGPTLRAILTKLSAALHTAITPIIYTAKVHEAARHIAILIAREAYLNGEITAEQYIIIGEYIRDQLVLPPVGMAQGEAQHNVQLATAAVVQKINEAKAENQNWERSTAVIHWFGSSPTPQNPEKRGVSPARPWQDFGLPDRLPGDCRGRTRKPSDPKRGLCVRRH